MVKLGKGFFDNLAKKSTRRRITAESIIQKALCNVSLDELIFEIDKEKKREKEGETNKANIEKMAYLYFILNEAHSAVKIGISSDPKGRFQIFQNFNLDKLKLLAIIPFKNARYAEKEIHKMLKKSRIRGEWFEYNSNVKVTIDVFINFKWGKTS